MTNQAAKNDLNANKIKLPQFFILQNFKKNSQRWSWVMRLCHFRAQNGTFVLNENFLSTNYCYYFHLPIGTFHRAKFKKIHVDPELWECAIFGPKMSYFSKWEFFQKTCYWALFLLFMPIYMPKTKDINLLVKCRWLKNTEI